MPTGRLTANGVELEVLEEGRGGRPLLLVHGFGGAKEDFADHVPSLAARGWHVVALDHRGHGESEHPDQPSAYGLRTLADDVLALADELGWARFCLLGHSMGGMVAQLVALARPDRLSGLVLMDTGHGPLEGIDLAAVELGKQVVAEGGMAALVEAQRNTDDAPLETPAGRRLLETRAGYQEFCDSKALRTSPVGWPVLIDEMVGQPDRLADLATLQVPTLVIVGEQDTPFVPACERMAGAIPGARLAVIPDAGHSPQFENPAAWFDALTGFLDDVALREPAPAVEGERA